jgi:hypothetical protein
MQGASVSTLINILLKPVPQNAGKAKLGSQENAAQLGHDRLTLKVEINYAASV